MICQLIDWFLQVVLVEKKRKRKNEAQNKQEVSLLLSVIGFNKTNKFVPTSEVVSYLSDRKESHSNKPPTKQLKLSCLSFSVSFSFCLCLLAEIFATL